jgi:hypothetical protein
MLVNLKRETAYYGNKGGVFMDNGQNQNPAAFLGLSREQLAKIVYEEFSKAGFQFSNFNSMLPSIVGRIFTENSSVSGDYLTKMLINGVLGSMFRKQL